MQEVAPLPPEKEIVPLRRHKMTEEEFQKIDIAKDLTPDQYSKLKALIMVYKDVFYFTPEDQGRYRLSYPPGGYKVFTLKPDAKPMRQKPYKMSIKERDILKSYCDDLVKRKIARYSLTSWGSPCLLIKRADQSRWRLVIDYRVLNMQTEEFKIVLPSIDDIYSSLNSA
jgi:hypothetical protein